MQNNKKQTALMLCASQQHIIEELLVESKITDDQGNTALMYAAESNNLKAVQLLSKNELKMQNCEGESALIVASRLNHH